MADLEDNVQDIDGVKISELEQAGQVDNDNDYLVISQYSDIYPDDYKSFKIHPNQLASQGVTYTAGDHIAISSSHVISATYENATTSADGLMSSTDKTKLDNVKDYTAGDNITISANNEISATDTKYSAGTNIQINDENVISATDTTYTAGDNVQISAGNVISATDTVYTLPVATDSVLGGVKQGTNVSIEADGTLSATDTTYTAGDNINISAQNVISATDTTYTAGTNVQINGNVISATDTVYTLPPATTSTLGGVIVGSGLSVSSDGTLSTTGGGGGSATLAGLDDVDISSPTEGQVLKYDSTNSEWINGTVSNVSSLDDLTNVTITTPTDGQVLKYDASSQEWINGTGGGTGSYALDDLTDVSVSTPTGGQSLVYDDTNNEWVNGAIEYSDVANTPTLATVATSGNYNDLSNTPTLATVATSGSYNDLSNTPAIPDELTELLDTSITSPANGDVLKYDSASSKWVNGQGGGGGASALDDLTDVNITTPTEGDTLVYDSTNSKWVNGAGGGGSAKQTAVTQAQYDALVQAGTVDPTMEYFITDGIPSSVEYYHIYSTDEKVVGTWIDGSTIYEKTLTVDNLSGNVNAWTNFAQLADVDKVINYDGRAVLNDGTQVTLGYYVMLSYLNGDLRYFCKEIVVFTFSLRLTVRYTKATS